jgi:hypothetical protein
MDLLLSYGRPITGHSSLSTLRIRADDAHFAELTMANTVFVMAYCPGASLARALGSPRGELAEPVDTRA